MSNNRQMNSAKIVKSDEFYTQLCDIENELKHYAGQFRDMIIFLNCDDPEESNFWKYLSMNFENFGLKKLMATHYRRGMPSCKLEMLSSKTIRTDLAGDGDFRSDEAIEALKECDIVITNPPFSLFREYMAQLIEYDKKFLIIGHQNAITQKLTFSLLKDKKIWFGHGFKGNASHFIVFNYEDFATSGDHKDGMIRVSGVAWFTNMETGMLRKPLDLSVCYSQEKHPRYDVYDAINVGRLDNIPMDYYEPMGVPITIMMKWNTDQFDVLDLGSHLLHGKKTYKRVTIKRKDRKSA